MLLSLLLFTINFYLIDSTQMKNKSDKELVLTSNNLILKHLVREPKVETSKNRAIILLHGVGSNEQDLFNLAGHLPAEFFVIAARAPFALGPERFAWYQVDFSTGKPVFNEAQELSSRETIRKFIAEVKQKYSLDEVYLGGFSQGAIMSYSIGLRHPKEVNGIIALSGRVLEDLQSTVTKNDELYRLKVFIAHGMQDATLPVHYAKQAKTFLQHLDVPLTYQEYNMGHQISGEVLKDLNAWLNAK